MRIWEVLLCAKFIMMLLLQDVLEKKPDVEGEIDVNPGIF
jgi:hypothetical protein